MAVYRGEELKNLINGEVDSDDEESLKKKEEEAKEEELPPLPEGTTAVTSDRGVLKKILKEGDGWIKPEKGDKVTVHYVGKLEDGNKFDSSRDRGEPFTFNLGQGQVIKGWDLGVATMKKGERAVLTITSDYGYGESGSPPSIPGGATLVFEVELLSWQSVKDICGDGGVIKTIIKEGSGYERALDNDEATVKITARVEGSTSLAAFYASPAEGDTFTVKEGFFCKAVGAAVKTMRKGEEVRLSVAPEYGFGDEGRGEEVPPGARLEIELTLVSYARVEILSEDGHSVVKKILHDIDGFKRPNVGAVCKIAYVGRLEDGTVFDERPTTDPLTFTIDDDEVPEGLEMAVLRMNLGEKALVTVGPKYGYGEQGSKQPKAEVPPNATLTYEVELVHMEKAKEGHQMENQEKVDLAAQLKDRGNAFFKQQRWERAVKTYKRGQQLIRLDANFTLEQKAKSKEIIKSCDLNLAAAYLKLGKWKECARVCSEVLDVENNNLKALFRRATAYTEMGDYVEAEMDIKQGLLVEPEAPDFKALYRRWKVVANRGQAKQARVYGGMFKAKSAAAKPAVAAAAAAPAENGNRAAAAAAEGAAAAATGSEEPAAAAEPMAVEPAKAEA